jgi:hypothetical protein
MTERERVAFENAQHAERLKQARIDYYNEKKALAAKHGRRNIAANDRCVCVRVCLFVCLFVCMCVCVVVVLKYINVFW